MHRKNSSFNIENAQELEGGVGRPKVTGTHQVIAYLHYAGPLVFPCLRKVRIGRRKHGRPVCLSHTVTCNCGQWTSTTIIKELQYCYLYWLIDCIVTRDGGPSICQAAEHLSVCHVALFVEQTQVCSLECNVQCNSSTVAPDVASCRAFLWRGEGNMVLWPSFGMFPADRNVKLFCQFWRVCGWLYFTQKDLFFSVGRDATGVARTVVLQKGKQGFGFVLRGAKCEYGYE